MTALVITSEAAEPQELAVTANFVDQEVSSDFTLTITLNRPLTEGRVAIMIGQTDFTNLFVPDGTSLNYLPRLLPLPAGNSAVRVFLVSPSNAWRELTQWTLRVKTAPLADSGQQETAGQAQIPTTDPTQSAAPKRYGFLPSLTLGLKSQVGARFFPASNRPERPTFNDLTLQASIKSEFDLESIKNQSQFEMIGSSFQKEALRFGLLGPDAPQLDLSSYLMQFQMGTGKLQVGHTSFGTNRHLINNYGSRGLSFTMPLGTRSDFSVAALNGTSTVGWGNFVGLNQSKHQMISATLGFELLSQRPGGLRLEAAALHGSLLPVAGFNQGVINDAEQSDGASLRLSAIDRAQRLKFEGGVTRSRFNNPADQLLNQNFQVVPVRETTRNAFYLDTSYALLKDHKLSEKSLANLNLNFRLERVDPLFRSVAAITQADRFQHEIEMTGSIGEITATVSHQQFHDNLGDIPTLMTTLSQRYAVIVAIPLSSVRLMLDDPVDQSDRSNQANPSIWLPRLAYSMNRFHQFGRTLPLNGGFDNPNQVPDQISTIHEFISEWQFQKWRLTYRLNQSQQDNRQPGREAADLRNLVNGVTFGLNPRPDFDLNFDLNIESAKNFEILRTDRTLRAGVNTNWRLTPKITINAIISNTVAGDLARTSRNRNTEFDLQWMYQFTRGESGWRKVHGHFFIRYADRYARMRDFLFGLDNLTRLKTLNCGINFVFF